MEVYVQICLLAADTASSVALIARLKYLTPIQLARLD